MIIQYNIVVTIVNLIDNSTQTFTKKIESEITAATDSLLYNNYHVLSSGVYILDIFKDEVDDYCTTLGIDSSSVEIDEFEIVSLMDRVDVFFETPDETFSLKPVIKAYVYPKYDELQTPQLVGIAYDESTIIWTWPNDEAYAHYLVEDVDVDGDSEPVGRSASPTDISGRRIIAQLPIGVNKYIESSLNPNTAYTRRLINYTAEQTSAPSASVTVTTETVTPTRALEEYNIEKNYDFTTPDEEREIIDDKLQAFHSGVGDFNDLKVYKQMDSDYYQKFKAYFELQGRRFQREKRYEQIGFNYKLCLEATEEVEEQEGEVTFDVEAYPREWIAVEDYMYATAPIIVGTKVSATIFLRKEDAVATDVIEEKLHRPKMGSETIETPEEFIGNPLGVLFICDTTGSLEGSNIKVYTNNQSGREVLRQSIINTIQKIEKSKGDLVDVKYGIVTFATSSILQTSDFVDADEAISVAKNMTMVGGTTNWARGVDGGNKLINQSTMPADTKYVAYFFSDGFPNQVYANQGGGGNYTDSKDFWPNVPSPNPKGWTSLRKVDENLLCNDLTPYANTLKSKCAIVGCFTCNFSKGQWVSQPNGDECVVDTTTGSTNGGVGCTGYGRNYMNRVNSIVASDNKYIKYWNDIGMSEMFEDFIHAFTVPGSSEEVTLFNGWEEYTVPGDECPIARYNLDDVQAVNVTTTLYKFAFLGNEGQVSQIPSGMPYAVTPVKYDRHPTALSERRAILEPTGFVSQQSILPAGQNLYKILLDAAKNTPQWRQGYNKTIGTIEDDGRPDAYLISNLYIQDTYGYADNEAMMHLNNFEDGMDGTVNVYSTVSLIDTPYYQGDNDGSLCYLVEDSDESNLYIQGYTDGIIYDYTMYVREELNAYDKPSYYITGPSVVNNSMLTNRKRPELNYVAGGGVDPINHVLECKEKGDDVLIKGYALPKVGYYVETGPITEDIEAYIEKWYTSPVLNYRFNIEDPDAKTPLYEIMPDCDPYNRYLHVVIFHVYYANNVYIMSESNYHGDPEPWMNVIAYKGDKCLGIVGQDSQGRDILQQNVYQWDRKEWQHGVGQDNGWYIDQYVWFMSKKMIKIRDYYDELPGKGIASFYGLVNGRYRADNVSGKQDLTVDTPQFNIPTTVTDKHADSVKIYCIITETHPESGLVMYTWEHPYSKANSITQVNGDYIYFSSDSMTYKDIEYIEMINTMNLENQELFDNVTVTKQYKINKPETVYEYQDYMLNVTTNNSDVLPIKFPTYVQFDDTGEANFEVSYKGIVNATSQWAPRIHNGYYYLNQYEYFAYSEFDVDANFDTYHSSDYKTVNGYINIEVNLKKPAPPREDYIIRKNTRAELLQDEKSFTWVNDRGLTIKPTIDGMYYKEYKNTSYISPKITFKNALTEAGPLTIDFNFDDMGSSSVYVPLEIRWYDTATLKWTEYQPFTNGSVPPALSNAYQLRCNLEAAVNNMDKYIEDYCCCYLDWKDDMSEQHTSNIVTVTDYMTTGPARGDGLYTSKIFDYGCPTSIQLDMFATNYSNTEFLSKRCQLYIAVANREEDLLLENAQFVNITQSGISQTLTGRYFRYRISVPEGEKVYWLHKIINTKETDVFLPYVTNISMTGSYAPTSTRANFINTEAFEIIANDTYQEVFPNILQLIESDIIQKGFSVNHIDTLNITCPTNDITIMFDKNIKKSPSETLLRKSNIQAKTPVQTEIHVTKTPYIRADVKPYIDDDTEFLDIITISRGTPQQYCPITIEDENGITYTELFDCDTRLHRNDYFTIDVPETYITLKRNDYEPETLNVYKNDILVPPSEYILQNHLLIFNNTLNTGDVIWVEYFVPHSFYSVIDREKDTTTLYIYTDYITCKTLNTPDTPEEQLRKYKVYFETGKHTNRFAANDLSLNPMYRTDYKGFIYLTDEHNEPEKIKIYCNPTRIKAGGYDRVDVQVEVLDIQDNPVISKEIAIGCQSGIINCDNKITDMNGVVHFVYESSVLPSADNLFIEVVKDDGSVIKESITIINE